MIQLDSAGVKLVAFLTWPKDTVKNIGVNLERIPVASDRDTVFYYLEKFLLTAGPYIDWIQIDQEPLGVTKYDTTYTMEQVLDWWRLVADFIQKRRSRNPSLSHLKIMTGGITGIRGLLNGGGSPLLAARIDSIIQFGEDYCDAIDVHLHTVSVDMGARQIAYLKERTNMPLATTEWSQARVAFGWLEQVNSQYGMTNRDVISNAYDQPMSPQEWQDLIATAPYTPNFIPDFYNVLNENEFVLACYGSAVQYGSPAYDWKQLKATKTTNPVSPNQPFYDEYISLADKITGVSLSQSDDNPRGMSFNLFQNVPNPFNPSTAINFYLSTSGDVELAVYDITGRRVRTLIQGFQRAGKHLVAWDGRDDRGFAAASGIYLCRLTADRKATSRRMVLMR